MFELVLSYRYALQKEETCKNQKEDAHAIKIVQEKSHPLKQMAFLLLSHKDSNLEYLNQNQMCYHYTMGQSLVYSLEHKLIVYRE